MLRACALGALSWLAFGFFDHQQAIANFGAVEIDASSFLFPAAFAQSAQVVDVPSVLMTPKSAVDVPIRGYAFNPDGSLVAVLDGNCIAADMIHDLRRFISKLALNLEMSAGAKNSIGCGFGRQVPRFDLFFGSPTALGDVLEIEGRGLSSVSKLERPSYLELFDVLEPTSFIAFITAREIDVIASHAKLALDPTVDMLLLRKTDYSDARYIGFLEQPSEFFANFPQAKYV